MYNSYYLSMKQICYQNNVDNHLHNNVNNHDEEDDDILMVISPAALFWPAVLIASLAKPNNFIFTCSVDLIHSAIIAAQTHLQNQPHHKAPPSSFSSSTTNGQTNNSWSVEKMFQDYRIQNNVVDNAVSVFESCAQLNFKIDFSISLCAILIRGLHHSNVETVLFPDPSILNTQQSDSSSSSSSSSSFSSSSKNTSKSQKKKHKISNSSASSSSSQISFLSLITPPETTRSPKLAVLELLTLCAKEATGAWLSAKKNKKITSTTMLLPTHHRGEHNGEEYNDEDENGGGNWSPIPYEHDSNHNNNNFENDSERDDNRTRSEDQMNHSTETNDAVPAYVVSLIIIYGIEKPETFITEMKAAFMEDDDWSLSPSFLEAKASPQRFHHSQTINSGSGSGSDSDSSFFFSSFNFPNTESACLAISMLFGYFLGGTCSGSKEDIWILDALKEAAWTIPQAFADIRGVVLPRLASIILYTGSRKHLENSGLVDVINSFLVLAFQSDENTKQHKKSTTSTPLSSSSNSSYGPHTGFNPVGTTNEIDLVIGAAYSQKFISSTPPMNNTTSMLVTNLDDGIDNDNDISVNAIDQSNKSINGDSNDKDDGVGAWDVKSKKNSKKKQNDETSQFRNNKTLKKHPSILTRLGFGQLLRLKQCTHNENNNDNDESDSDDDDDDSIENESSMFDDDELYDENVHDSMFQGFLFRYDLMIDPDSQERIAVLSGDLFGKAGILGEEMINKKINNQNHFINDNKIGFKNNQRKQHKIDNMERKSMKINQRWVDLEEDSILEPHDHDDNYIEVLKGTTDNIQSNVGRNVNQRSGDDVDNENENNSPSSTPPSLHPQPSSNNIIDDINKISPIHSSSSSTNASMSSRSLAKAPSIRSLKTTHRIDTISPTPSSSSRIRTRPLPSRARSSTLGNNISSNSNNSGNNMSNNSNSLKDNIGPQQRTTPRQHRSASSGETPIAVDLTHGQVNGPQRRRPRSQSPRGRPISPTINK